MSQSDDYKNTQDGCSIIAGIIAIVILILMVAGAITAYNCPWILRWERREQWEERQAQERSEKRRLREIQELGDKIFEEGVWWAMHRDSKDNPYSPNSPAAIAWDNGYKTGKQYVPKPRSK